jgi:hypothetical protein
VDKINEMYIAVTSGLLAVGLWIFKRLFKSIDLAHERIDRLESKNVDRAYLESQLVPIRQDLKIILKHLLGTKND